ncbi:hypothetical protein ACH5RR_039093 [Cinchona calisaya]|uniref:Uncharacterized protein n=1 Tax=Cinchona calisaya TaxID=153742 RepID=A0ABD2Y057_9GENT
MPKEQQPPKVMFDDHEQPMDLVDDTPKDILSDVSYNSSNVDLTKNPEDGGNDVVNSQARTQMEKTIVIWKTPPIQTTSLEKQQLKIFKPLTLPLPPIASELHSEEVISNCQRGDGKRNGHLSFGRLRKTFFESIEIYNSVNASIDRKMSQESCEGLHSTAQQNLYTVKIQEQEQIKSVEDLEAQIAQLSSKEAELKQQLEQLCT